MTEYKLVPTAAPSLARGRDRIEYYHGLRQKTDKALHAQIAGYIKKHIWSDRSAPLHVLDWGCGEGALSLRLFHMGMDVVAVDMDSASFRAEGPRFHHIDFNNPSAVDDFVESHKGRFDLIIATEVIEHIHDPWFFLNRLRRMCNDSTHVIITTPNISNWWGRVWFLLTGELWGFSREGWYDPGHVNPITDGRFEGLVSDTGFQIVGKAAGGYLPIIWLYNSKRFIVSLLALPLRLVQRGRLDGWANFYHLKINQLK